MLPNYGEQVPPGAALVICNPNLKALQRALIRYKCIFWADNKNPSYALCCSTQLTENKNQI